MPEYTRGYREQTAAQGEPGTPIRFVASTDKVGRDGMVIDQNGWDLANFKRSPVILWSHDYTGQRPPIGRADKVWVEGNQLMVDIVFDQGDPFARDVERKYRENFLSSVSVGWNSLEVQPPRGAEGAPKVTRAELLDISAVNIPGDPNALMERQRIALRSYAEDILAEVTNPTTDPEPDTTASRSWADTSAEMARLFWPHLQGPEADREKAYKRLAREYDRHGRTAPEYIPTDDLNALDADHVRGLFLEGEPDDHAGVFAAMDARAGAVLSQRNLDDLTRASELADQIRDLVAGVVERGKKPPKPDEDETDMQRGGDPDPENAALERVFQVLEGVTL